VSLGLKEDLLPALSSAIAGSDGDGDNLLATLGEASRVTAKNAIVGFDDGLIEITRAAKAGERESSILSGPNDTVSRGLSLILVTARIGARRSRSRSVPRPTPSACATSCWRSG
jgi:hypothetical protein